MAIKPVVNRNWLSRAVDSAFEAFSPGQALQRHKARTALAYAAARQNRERRSASQTPYHPDSSITQRDRVTLMMEARDLAENVGFVKGHLRKVQLYAAGTLAYEPDTGDAGMDSEISAFLAEWMPIAHTGLDHTFTRLIQLAAMGMTRDGDSMLVWCRDEDALRLQIVEADQIGELHSFQNSPAYTAGVYRNPDGSRWGYRVYDRLADMQYGNEQDIPAQDALFFYDPMRLSVRGITAYDAAITNIRDKFEILGYEKIIVKDISTRGVITYTQRAGADQFDYDGAATNSDGSLTYIRHKEAGVQEYMGIGEKFEVVNHNRPGATFQGFLKMLDTEDCHTVNLPYGFLVDPSEPGGVAARIIAHVASREFARLQNDVINPNLCKIRDVLLIDAAARGRISRHPNLLRGTWMFPPPPTADIQRESDIAIKEVRSGLSTYTEQYAIYGQSRARQWKIKKQEVIDKYLLAHEATQELKALGVSVTVSPEEIAATTDNPAGNQNPQGAKPGEATPTPSSAPGGGS